MATNTKPKKLTFIERIDERIAHRQALIAKTYQVRDYDILIKLYEIKAYAEEAS